MQVSELAVLVMAERGGEGTFQKGSYMYHAPGLQEGLLRCADHGVFVDLVGDTDGRCRRT